MGAVWLETTVTRWANGSLLRLSSRNEAPDFRGSGGYVPSACCGALAFQALREAIRCCQRLALALGASRMARFRPGAHIR